jgi:RNA polymerase sigma-70 factor, ECF subfamily
MDVCAVASKRVSETSQAVQNDLRLVARAKGGDQEAFATLFDLHKRNVYSLCLRMTRDTSEAEDLTQDAFIQVFRKLESFRGDSSFSTWLYRVAVNTVLMKLRRKQLKAVSLDEPVRTDPRPVQREVGRNDLNLLGSVDRITLQRAIQKLPEGCRRIFLLHELEGYEHRAIARMLRCSVGNSKSQLHKARLRIRELLFRIPQSRSPKDQASSAIAPRTPRLQAVTA